MLRFDGWCNSLQRIVSDTASDEVTYANEWHPAFEIVARLHNPVVDRVSAPNQ